MSEENPKYLSAYTGAQIDKAYKTVSNIQPSGSGKLVMINSNGELVASPYSSGETANKPINWSVATSQNFIQYAGAGETRVSDYNADSFMRSVAIAVDNNIPTFYKQGNIVCLQDSGVSISSIQEALSNVGTLSNNEIVSGSVNTTYPESLILTKKNAEVINIDLAQFADLFQKKITVSNKLNADLVYNGITNIFLTPGDQSITGNKTFTGSTRFDFGNEDYVYLQQSSYYFGHTNGENKTYVNIQPTRLDVSYVNASNNEQYVDLSLNSIDKSFRVSGESGNYSSYILLNPTQTIRQNENTSSEFYSRESATPTSYQIYLNNPTYEKSYQLNASSNGIGIYADCDNYNVPSGTGHHVGSMVVSYENYTQLYGYDNTNDDNAHVKVDYKSYEIAADNDYSGAGSKISGDKDIIRLRIYDEDGDLKNVTINSTGAYIDNKEIAVKEDIPPIVESAIDDLIDDLENSFTTDLLVTSQIKSKNSSAYFNQANGLEIYEDASEFRLQHSNTDNGNFKLVTDSSKTILTGTVNNAPQLVLKQDGGFALVSGSRHTTLSVNDDYSTFGISAEFFSLAGTNNMLLIDHNSLRYNQGVGGKNLITASPDSTVISGGNGSMAADNNSTRLIYGTGANPNILSIDSDSADLRINGTSAKIEINNNIMQMKLGDYKVLTDQNYGYFELTGTSGILTADQLAQAAKRYCVIRANNKNYIKAYDNNFYYFEMPYAYNYQETIEGVIYNYLTHKWPFSVLRINLSRYEISSVPLEMMSYDQIKLLVNQCVSGDITHLISQVQVDDPSMVPSSALMYSVNSRVVELETQLAEALTTIRGLTSRIESLEAEKDKLYRQGVMYRDDTIYEINIYDDHGVYLGSGIHYDNQGNAEVVGYADGTAKLYSYDGTKQLIIEGSDSDLEQRLEDEIRNRQDADDNLQSQIDSIAGNYIRVRNGS